METGKLQLIKSFMSEKWLTRNSLTEKFPLKKRLTADGCGYTKESKTDDKNIVGLLFIGQKIVITLKDFL